MKCFKQIYMSVLAMILMIPLNASKLLTMDSRCVSPKDMNNLEIALQGFKKASLDNNVSGMATFMHFPITDNHNHAITQRVFLEEADYDPVISVKKLFKEVMPPKLATANIKHYGYLDYCNMYVVEHSLAENKRGIRFVFKKIGKYFLLKLIRLGKQGDS